MKKRQNSEDFIRKLCAKLHIKIAHDTISILRLLRDDDRTISEYAQHLGLSRYQVNYQVNKLVKAKLATRTKNSQYYRPTYSGANVLDQYDSTEKKYQIGIENARWKVLIRNPKLLQKFLWENGFTHHAMNNWIQWNGDIDGWTIQVNESLTKTTMVITHQPVYSGNFMDEYKNAEKRILTIFSNLDKKWNFKMGVPEPLSTGQFTLNNPIAEHMMEKTSGSQIKIADRLSFDQSFGSEPRTELSNLSDAMLWESMPRMFFESLKLQQENKEDWKILKPTMISMAKSFEIMVKTQGDMMDSLKEITKVLTGIIEGGSEKPVSKIKDLDDFSSRMFG